MGSELIVTSELGNGTTFTFELDLQIIKEVRDSKSRAQAKSVSDSVFSEMAGEALSGARILVVEDNTINQQLVSDILTLSGMHVKIAGNGQEALNILNRQSFDAILMDIQMPVMGGIEATRSIRNQAGFQQIPIIALSASVTPAEREKCFACGMNDFIPKPFNPEDLIQKLKQWVTHVDAAIHPNSIETAETFKHDSVTEIDQNALLDKLGNNSELMIKMLLTFRQDNPKTIQEIAANLKAGEIDSAETILHSLKGVVGFLCADELYEASQKLDFQLKNHHYDPDLLSSWLEINERTMLAISKIVETG
jgi:CheY-like chemotaxis protein/HPt (histidine-containing phosphotransfer) domain-containing protein